MKSLKLIHESETRLIPKRKTRPPHRKPTFKKLFTVPEANATLPLLRAILRDVTELAAVLRQRHERLMRMKEAGSTASAFAREVEELTDEHERDQERMRELENELKGLQVVLKDYDTGLVDFPSMRDDRVVFLCWRLDEPEVAHWHELDSGFQGRKKLESGGVPN